MRSKERNCLLEQLWVNRAKLMMANISFVQDCQDSGEKQHKITHKQKQKLASHSNKTATS